MQPPPYENPPAWLPPQERLNSREYNNDVRKFLPRVVKIFRRSPTDTLGFNIRSDDASVFVTQVYPNTEAAARGLQPGDQILTVNNSDVQQIGFENTLKLLKQSIEVEIRVRFFPHLYNQLMKRS